MQLGDNFHIFFCSFLQVVRLFGSFINKVGYTTLEPNSHIASSNRWPGVRWGGQILDVQSQLQVNQ